MRVETTVTQKTPFRYDEVVQAHRTINGKAVFKFVVDTRFQLERKSSLEIIWRSRNNSSKLDFM